MNYYNENDPQCVKWLRELIKEGLIPDGDVDDRSIVDVKPHELTKYTQQHFFAGIGGWSLALQLAGWLSDRPVRTGSCPCQPFSCAGQQKGEKDERHLWPFFRDLITFGEATTTFGEQVASKLGRQWLSRVRSDLEGLGYAVGAADLCAAGAGAPHIRQRLFWVADYAGERWDGRQDTSRQGGRTSIETSGFAGRVEHSEGDGRQQRRTESSGRGAGGGCREDSVWMVDSVSTGGIRQKKSEQGEASGGRNSDTSRESTLGMGYTKSDCKQRNRKSRSGDRWPLSNRRPGAWSDFDVLPFIDGKARRVESGSFPLAHGVSNRVAKLRGLGNAIVPPLAAQFIRAFMQTLKDT